MISFIVCLAIIICGYLTYGKVVDNTSLRMTGRHLQ